MSNIAKQSYRQALRATRIAFQQDLPMLLSARGQIKQGFVEGRTIPETEAVEAIEKMNSVSKFLIENLVQGIRKTGERYELQFHDKTELGDNDSIKNTKSEMGLLAGKRASRR